MFDDMRKSTSPTKTASSRQSCSSITAVVDTTLSEAVRKPSETSQELIDGPGEPQTREDGPEGIASTSAPSVASEDPVGVCQKQGHKRRHGSEEERSNKRRRGSWSESGLSRRDLKKLSRHWESLERSTPEEMDACVTVPAREQKRTPSRQTSSSDLNQDTASNEIVYQLYASANYVAKE